MGTAVQEFNEQTRTNCDTIKADEIERRKILRDALEAEGVINFPDEWWHFSYGDRLWAVITKSDRAFYAPID
jgi:D-alanyl-D-alanine dipeptidase